MNGVGQKHINEGLHYSEMVGTQMWKTKVYLYIFLCHDSRYSSNGSLFF